MGTLRQLGLPETACLIIRGMLEPELFPGTLEKPYVKIRLGITDWHLAIGQWVLMQRPARGYKKAVDAEGWLRQDAGGGFLVEWRCLFGGERDDSVWAEKEFYLNPARDFIDIRISAAHLAAWRKWHGLDWPRRAK